MGNTKFTVSKTIHLFLTDDVMKNQAYRKAKYLVEIHLLEEFMKIHPSKIMNLEGISKKSETSFFSCVLKGKGKAEDSKVMHYVFWLYSKPLINRTNGGEMPDTIPEDLVYKMVRLASYKLPESHWFTW